MEPLQPCNVVPASSLRASLLTAPGPWLPRKTAVGLASSRGSEEAVGQCKAASASACTVHAELRKFQESNARLQWKVLQVHHANIQAYGCASNPDPE